MSCRETVLIGASMAALVVLSLFAYFCSNRQQRRAAGEGGGGGGGDGEDVELGRRHRRPVGIDEAVLAAYPTAVYKSRLGDGDDQAAAAAAAALKTASATAAAAGGGEHRPSPDDVDVESTLCAVCLADYADGDELRRIPGCQHAFHRPCIDQWLRRRSTCPVCRTAPPPTAD